MGDLKFVPSFINSVKKFFMTFDPTSDEIAVISAIIAGFALILTFRTSRKQIKLQNEQTALQRKQIELEKITAKLADVQLEKFNEVKNKTKIEVRYIRKSHNTGIIELNNTGEVFPKNVIFWYELDENARKGATFDYMETGGAQYCDSEKKKIKFSTIRTSRQFKIIYAHLSSIEVFWSWENPDGSHDEGEETINLTV
jgi:hypothetical protein